MEDTKELMQKKARYFFENKIKIHLKKKNGYIHNGLILELEGDLMILDDKKNGAMPIYFLEIFEIEKMEKEE